MKVVSVAGSVEEPGAWAIRATHYVGVLHVDSTLEVRIRPKVPIDRLLFLVTYSRDDDAWRTDVADFVIEDDLISSMCWAYAHHAEEALARGVLQSYVTVEDVLPGLRGRLREADQLRRQMGLPVPVEVRFDDYTVDNLENRLLLAACRRLLKLPELRPEIRSRLRHLTVRLDGVSGLERGQLSRDIRFTRLNERYRPAIRLAQAVLRGTSLEFGVGPHRGVGFVFDMNRVFEDYVTGALGRALKRFGGRVAPQHTTHLDVRRVIELRPDLTWLHSGRCRAVIDAKYKLTEVDEVPNADVYQAVSYCLALDVPTAYLIYAAGNATSGVHEVVHSDLHIVVAPLDISASPAEAIASVERVADEIAKRTDGVARYATAA
jgi:5-methylcytosine-specific restriction enzyme subunit McrC